MVARKCAGWYTKKSELTGVRGEIAVRILSAARELDYETVAIYLRHDTSHISHADSAVVLPDASGFMNIELLVSICRKHSVDAVHPGYGFLSESAEFAEALKAAGVAFVGPDADVLRATGDKLSARQLAEQSRVPVLPALKKATKKVEDIVRFAKDVGWPVMLKAADGGGGRGIRLVRKEEELKSAFERALAESPGKVIFAEKALVDDCRHIEVQILGDGEKARHFWERECSIQRRYQKVVEIAPSTLRNGESDDLIKSIIRSALQLATDIGYRSLGTFEFLASPKTGEYYFMEINPRLQVEHTITESIAHTDLVQLQLLVADGQKLSDLVSFPSPEEPPPPGTSIQLRVTAEDPRHDFALSIGRINGVTFPGGNGVRVDSHIRPSTIISSDFDSLLAKIIVTAPSYATATAKGIRALTDLSIEGITTNKELLVGILLSKTFQTASCDTHWLGGNIGPATDAGQTYLRSHIGPTPPTKSQPMIPKASKDGFSTKKGDQWQLSVTKSGDREPFEQTVQVQKIMRNDLPHNLTLEVKGQDKALYTFRLSQSDPSSQTGARSNKRQADTQNPDHLNCPLSGQLVEMLVDEGDEVKEFDSVAIVSQMKMELEVRAHKKGIVKSIWDVDDGENVESGMLVCEIVDDDRPLKGKL